MALIFPRPPKIPNDNVLHVFKKILSFPWLSRDSRALSFLAQAEGPFPLLCFTHPCPCLLFNRREALGSEEVSPRLVIIWVWEEGVAVCLDLLRHSKQVLRLHESLLYVRQPWEGKMLCRRDTAGTSVIPILPSLRHFFRTLHRELFYQHCACCSRNTYNTALSNELSHPIQPSYSLQPVAAWPCNRDTAVFAFEQSTANSTSVVWFQYLILPSAYKQHVSTLQWKHREFLAKSWQCSLIYAQQSLNFPPAEVTLTYVAVVHPDALPIVPAPAFHHVIWIIGFSNFVVWVDDNLGSDGETQHKVI